MLKGSSVSAYAYFSSFLKWSFPLSISPSSRETRSIHGGHNCWEPAKLVKTHAAKSLPLTYPLQDEDTSLLWLMAPGFAKLLSRAGAWLSQHRAQSPLSSQDSEIAKQGLLSQCQRPSSGFALAHICWPWSTKAIRNVGVKSYCLDQQSHNLPHFYVVTPQGSKTK